MNRVRAEAEKLSLGIDILELKVSTKTALQAADVIKVHVDQIAKSIIFKGATTGRALLFLTAGGNRVDAEAAAQAANEPLERADAEFIRTETGFAIGGVSPIGHIKPVLAFFDPRLLDFELIWAAAGTPNHMFEIEPKRLAEATSAQITEFTQSL